MDDDLRRIAGRAGRMEEIGACASEEEIWNLAAGLGSGEEAAGLLNHVSRCDVCGAKLHSAQADFLDPPSSEERAFLAELPGARRGRRAQLAKRLSRAAKMQGPALSSHRVIAGLAYAAGIGVCAIGLWFGYRGWQVSRANQLVAQAYSEERTIQLRFVGEAYGPFREKRAGEQIAARAVTRAEAAIDEATATRTHSPALQQARARVMLLEWRSDEALAALAQIANKSPSVLIDLASAHFEHGMEVNDFREKASAVEILSRVLRERPGEAVAHFNRALVYEDLQIPHEAIRDWEAYLREDPNSAWAAEARKHLERLRRESGRNRLRLESDPSGFLSVPAGLVSPELYLQQATGFWLPQACAKSFAARAALKRLAAGFESTSSDPWLAELIEDQHADICPAHRLLAKALTAGAEGNADAAAAYAQDAISAYRRAKNSAGEARATLELAYERTRAQTVRQCELSKGDLARLRRSRFVWIAIDSAIEKGLCEAATGLPGMARNDFLDARERAEAAHYSNLSLRALGMMETADTIAGDEQNAWKEARTGLMEFWSGPHACIRGYQFYSDLTIWAETTRHQELALALARESTRLADCQPNVMTRGLAHYLLGLDAATAGAEQEAVREFGVSEAIFQAAPESESAIYRTYCLLNKATLKATGGSVTGAISELEQLRPKVRQYGQVPMLLQYYRSLGQAYAASGDDVNAERHLRTALGYVRLGVESFHNERELASWNADAEDVYRELARIFCQAHRDPQAAFELWTEHRRMQIYGVSQAAPAVRESQPAGVLTITTIQFKARMGVWVSFGSANHFSWAPVTLSEAGKMADQIVSLCADPESEVKEIRRLGERVYRLLFNAAEPYLSSAELVSLNVDGPLTRVPIQVLTDGAGRYVGERVTVARSASTPGTAALQALQIESALVVVNPLVRGASGRLFRPLSTARREAKSILSRFPRVSNLEGASATAPEVERRARQATLFHFAGHATRAAGGMALVLSPARDGRDYELLAASDIEGTMRGCRLAVLAACSTSSDGDGSADELAAACLRAGPDTVIGSAWDVDSEATSTLMDIFYQRISQGDPPCQALRAASNRIRGMKEYAHPYYWAAFSCNVKPR